MSIMVRLSAGIRQVRVRVRVSAWANGLCLEELANPLQQLESYDNWESSSTNIPSWFLSVKGEFFLHFRTHQFG